MNREPLIVGIDPGNTSAVVALDLDGEEVILESKKEFSQDEIIELLIEKGTPIVVACDKEKMPSTVDKIASSLGARKFVPEDDLSRARKEKLGRGDNSHEKDAYAAAIHAFKSLRKAIDKINKRSNQNNRLEIARKHIGVDKDV